MIYNIGSTIELVGQEADNFLEASGITICDDEIIIEDAVVEFNAAIEHLAENGISLYEDCIILEGKQAEEYKARKAKEKEDRDKQDLEEKNKYETRRLVAGMKHPKRVDGKLTVPKEDYLRHRAAVSSVNNEFNNRERKYDQSRSMQDLENFGNLANNMAKARDAQNRHMRRNFHYYEKKYGSKSESTIFDSVELIGIDEQVFFKYKKDSQGLLYAEAKKLAGIVNGIDLSDDSHLSKYGIHIDKIEYADDSFILRRKFNVKIHFGYDYKIKSEDIDYEVVEKLMDAILAKAGYRKYGRYSVKKGNGYLFAIDYQDIYIEESDQYYTVNYGTGDMPMTSGMTSRAHTPEQRYIDIDIKCIEDTPGNMSLLRK